jgi:N-acyl homoserine lactone hydrolase
MYAKEWLVGLTAWALLGLPLSPAAAQSGTADRLYVMDCGHNAATDQSRWSPGVNVGKPIELSDNCYLIRHGADWLLWDTGYPDAVAEKPITSPIGTATRAKTLAAQLAEVGVKPTSAMSRSRILMAIISATSTCFPIRRC